MERAMAFKELRKGKLSEEFLREFPKEVILPPNPSRFPFLSFSLSFFNSPI